jgi:hypothetical protein
MLILEGCLILMEQVGKTSFKEEAIPLCENPEVYICLRLETTVVHNSR